MFGLGPKRDTGPKTPKVPKPKSPKPAKKGHSGKGKGMGKSGG